MWQDIILSIGTSVFEALGGTFIEKRNRTKIQRKINGIISEEFQEFADSSLDCNEFSVLVNGGKFMEIIRNFYLAINDGADRNSYMERVEQYIYLECEGVSHIEVRQFIKKFEELYDNYLHTIIEECPEIYALFQLMTISHREIIKRILESEENIKKYIEALECKKITIDNENIKLYHSVSENEFGKIRFTGIAGAERRKEQDINEFYVANTFSYYGKEIERIYPGGLDKKNTIKLENFFDLGNKIVLIGGAGLGKTTSLNYLFCNYEKMYGSYALKIKLDLKDYAEDIGVKKKGILWCITTEFSKKIRHTQLRFEEIQLILSEFLSKGKCFVILDALDEISTLSIRSKVRDEIANFCEIYYLNRFIISSREAGYLRNKFDDTFLHIKINHFTMTQIKKYSKNWYKLYYDTLEDFDDFWDKFYIEVERARCEGIISNPIILILALVIFDIEKNLPTKRIQFYQKCIETFLTEREDRKAAYALDEKTKNILAMGDVLPKIAHYKYENVQENIRYKLGYDELINSVYYAIEVPDKLNWAAAVKQYIEYLVERTELVQEVDEFVYDFAHKTFYEYFLAVYFCLILDEDEVVDLLEEWIGDSNNDELARLIIEAIIQNGKPRKIDFVMNYLFEKLESNNEVYNYDVFSILIDLYNHNMLQPKHHARYHRCIMYNPKFVYRVVNNRSGHKKLNGKDIVKYDSGSLAELFYQVNNVEDNLIAVLDSLAFLSKEYKRKVSEREKADYINHSILLFEYVINLSKEREYKDTREFERLWEKEINYFMNEGLNYILNYPQIYLSVISLAILIKKDLDIDLLLEYKFGANNEFFSYTHPQVLYAMVDKAMIDADYFALFLNTLMICARGRVNHAFEFIIDRRVYRGYGKNEESIDKEREYGQWMWEIFNYTKSYQEFKDAILNQHLYVEKYEKLYKEVYDLYTENEKGRGDKYIKRELLGEN